MQPKNKNSLKNKIINYGLIVLLLIVMFVPSAKALLQRGLMAIGLFKPNLEIPKEKRTTQKSDYKMTFISDHDGAQLDLNSLKGKVVFINFWATWCPPCIAEMPTIEKLYSNFQNDPEVAFVLMDVDANQEKTRKFLKKHNINSPIYYPASSIPNEFYDGTLPSTVVLDKNGNIVEKWSGMRNYGGDKMVEFLKALK